MLILPIKRQWFNMILRGEKKEEYREIKPYYDSRFMNYFGMIWIGGELINTREILPELAGPEVKEVVFRNGYSANSPEITCKCSLRAGTGKEEWGAEPGKQYYILEIKSVDCKICGSYVGVSCVDGSCPIANREEYEERDMFVIKSCRECHLRRGCEDCALDNTEHCAKRPDV